MQNLFPGSRLLAPMVKGSILPFRLLCLRHGADFVYSEETIAHRFVRTESHHNEDFNVTEFIDYSDGTKVFSTTKEEKDRVVFQLGVADPDLAVIAAKKVNDYVAAVDINMGCPKKFSVGGGMGAALLKDPERAASIIKALSSDPEINIPVTVKVRFQDTVEKTAEFCRLMKDSGACQVALHMRSIDDRPTVRAQWMKFAEVQLLLDFPLIANGDFFQHLDIENFEKNIGNNPIMIARGAQWNPCIFHKDDEAGNNQVELVREFLKLAIETGTVFQSMKYVVGELLSKSKVFLQAVEMNFQFLL